ncbi:MAG: rane spanning protein [Firmicutes bacterium]|nr:rane spanning protein [Bacillota bacterium]
MMLLRNFLLICTATFGLSVIFNIKGRNLFFSALGAGLTWLAYSLALDSSSLSVYAVFLGSLAAGIYSEAMARIRRAPVTVFVICSIIPLVPGLKMLDAMLEVLKGNTETATSYGITVLITAGLIAIGIFVVSSSFRLAAFLKKSISAKQKTSS